MEYIGGQAITLSWHVWNEVTRGGTHIICGPFMQASKQDIVGGSNALTVEASGVGISIKGLARTDAITATVELLETENGQDEPGSWRRQMWREMLSEFEEDDSNHETMKSCYQTKPRTWKCWCDTHIISQ